MINRPKVSIIVFNENSDSSIQTLVESIEKLDIENAKRCEFVLVIFNKKLSEENRRLVFRLKQRMTIRFMDYSETYEKDLKVYSRASNQIEKKENDTIINEEITKYFI